MKENMNYINTLPDFLAMQRISFCWFITQGLTEELALFSRIHDFSQNTEYIIFGEEYNLIKPPYNLLIARKYSGSYRAQLVIPIEVRNKTINSIRPRGNGIGSEVASVVQERCFYSLESPIERVCGLDTPFPLTTEPLYLPGKFKLVQAIKRSLELS